MCKRLTNFAVAMFIATAICGCITPKDSSFRVKGHVQAPEIATRECKLAVIRAKDNKVVEERSVKADFNESFVVAPKTQQYLFQLTCPGLDGRFQSQTYVIGSAARASSPIELGRIDLK